MTQENCPARQKNSRIFKAILSHCQNPSVHGIKTPAFTLPNPQRLWCLTPSVHGIETLAFMVSNPWRSWYRTPSVHGIYPQRSGRQGLRGIPGNKELELERQRLLKTQPLLDLYFPGKHLPVVRKVLL